MTSKNTFIVVDDDAALDTFDVHSLGFINRSDVEKVAGVILRDTRMAHLTPPIFYYDDDGCINGFEGWGWDQGEAFLVADTLKLSFDLVTI